MRGRTIFAVVSLAAAIAAVLAGSAAGVVPGPNGRIFYESNQTPGGVHNIWSINPEGTGATQLTNVASNAQAAERPSVSGDGSKVAYFEFGDVNGHFNTSQIWIMNGDGSGQTQLTSTVDNLEDTEPGISPDGSKIVFQRVDLTGASGTGFDIWEMNADGSHQTQLTSSSDAEISAEFSPDGTKIVYVRQSPTNQIWIMGADGSNQHVLLNNPGQQDRGPSWSPNGAKIVYSEDGNGLYVMNADGSNPTQLLDGSGHPIPGQDPTWSPDGTQIAFYAAPGGAPGAGLYTIPAGGGSDPTPVVLTGDFQSEYATWAAVLPDGIGTLAASPLRVRPGTSANTLSFTFQAPFTSGLVRGAIQLTVPPGWTAPQSTTPTGAGYVTANAGHVAVVSRTIVVSSLDVLPGNHVTIVYGAKAGGGPGASSPATGSVQTWQAKERSTPSGTPVALASSPTVDVLARDGSGTMTTPTTNVVHSSAGNTIHFTYTAAPGGIADGSVTLYVPTGWSAPSLTGTAAGYFTASTGTRSISGHTIVLNGVTLAGGATLTITYGARGGGGPGATATGTTGTQHWVAKERSSAAGTLTPLATSPAISVG